MTSHTAIISRELGVPCVIGTEIGTRVFKDDDMLEVDADNGVIKRMA
jgi:pyruvate,water dikinase